MAPACEPSSQIGGILRRALGFGKSAPAQRVGGAVDGAPFLPWPLRVVARVTKGNKTKVCVRRMADCLVGKFLKTVLLAWYADPDIIQKSKKNARQ